VTTMEKAGLGEDLDAYFAAKDRVHEGFDYVPDWVEIPLDDARKYYWMLVGGEGRGATCAYSKEPFTEESIKAGTEFWSGSVYTQRFLKKWVYRTETHVMVAVDTHTDGNKFLMVFDAARECTDEKMKNAWSECWA
jgi:hypothetical protein